MSAKITIDYSEMQRAMREYAKVTSQDGAGIINRFGKDVAFKAVTLTPKAEAAAIAVYAPTKPGYPGQLHFAKAAKAGARKGSDPSQVTRTKTGRVAKKQLGGPMTQAANKSFARAKASSGYIKAGWFNAIVDMGGKPSARTPKPRRGSAANKGHGTKATARSLIAWIYNFVPGADKMGEDALQSAVNYVARSKLDYAKKKLAVTARKFSGRKNSRR